MARQPDTGIVVTVFAQSPDRGAGLARDMPVRWALEEVGQAYEVRPLTFEAMKRDEHRARQPFGQIPAFEQGDLVLFESGAIVLHIAQRYPGLLPADADGRARAISWMFAATSTVEPTIAEREIARYLESDKPWHDQRLPLVEERIRVRLGDVARRLGDSEWLDGDFSAGDLMMVSALRRLAASGLLDGFANLGAYVARAEARPAFQRAFAAQRALFTQTMTTEH